LLPVRFAEVRYQRINPGGHQSFDDGACHALNLYRSIYMESSICAPIYPFVESRRPRWNDFSAAATGHLYCSIRGQCSTGESDLRVPAAKTVKLCREIFGPPRPDGKIAGNSAGSNPGSERAGQRRSICTVYGRSSTIRRAK
jgi:hypothetical protein